MSKKLANELDALERIYVRMKTQSEEKNKLAAEIVNKRAEIEKKRTEIFYEQFEDNSSPVQVSNKKKDTRPLAMRQVTNSEGNDIVPYPKSLSQSSTNVDKLNQPTNINNINAKWKPEDGKGFVRGYVSGTNGSLLPINAGKRRKTKSKKRKTKKSKKTKLSLSKRRKTHRRK